MRGKVSVAVSSPLRLLSYNAYYAQMYALVHLESLHAHSCCESTNALNDSFSFFSCNGLRQEMPSSVAGSIV